jgi:hypothetical protein
MMAVMKFCCGSALEAQRAGTRAAANKSKNRTRGARKSEPLVMFWVQHALFLNKI